MSTRILGDEIPDTWPSVERLRHHVHARWVHNAGRAHVPITGMTCGYAEPEREQGRVRLMVINAQRGGA